MLHSLSENIAAFLFDDNDKYPMDVYIYGIELTISSLIGKILVLIIGIVTNCFVESLVFMVTLSSIRRFCGGYHSNSYLGCNLIYIISLLLVLLSYTYVKAFDRSTVIILFAFDVVITLAVLAMFAPVKNKNKHIDDFDEQKYRLISVILFIALSVVSVILYCFDFTQVLVVIPTFIVIDISILVEVINKKRMINNEKSKRIG